MDVWVQAVAICKTALHVVSVDCASFCGGIAPISYAYAHDGTELPEKKAEGIQMVNTSMLIDINY